MKIFSLFILPILAMAVSCAPSTPQKRIEKNIAMYTSQPAKHQELVKRGELARGMSKEAVFLAWGNPAQRFQIMQNKELAERWDYTGSQPVYSNSFGMGYGVGHGWGRRSSFSTFSYSPEVTYVPYRKATVLFKHSKVDSWERAQ